MASGVEGSVLGVARLIGGYETERELEAVKQDRSRLSHAIAAASAGSRVGSLASCDASALVRSGGGRAQLGSP
jgi:hypothetical protein